MASEGRNELVIKRKGNGTGPGTPYPIRRGPTKGPRKPKGYPPHLRSIEVHIGGRWKNAGNDEVVYEGGFIRYMHNVNPSQLKVPELFMFAQMVLTSKVLLPSRMWWMAYDEEAPAGLRPITGEDKLQEMWANCDKFGRWIARLYMQDVEVIRSGPEDADGKMPVTYYLPSPVPRIDRSFIGLHLHDVGNKLHKEMKNQGAYEIGRQEIHGERWYIHTEKKPYVPVPRSVSPKDAWTTSFMMEGLPNHWHGKFTICKGHPPGFVGKAVCLKYLPSSSTRN